MSVSSTANIGTMHPIVRKCPPATCPAAAYRLPSPSFFPPAWWTLANAAAAPAIVACITQRYGGCFCDDNNGKVVYVTLGIFTIVQLIRNVQMLVPVYDYCMPSKECCPTSDNPCDLFRKMCFPVEEFFPPKSEGHGCDCDGER